jgi:hypothetical protein
MSLPQGDLLRSSGRTLQKVEIRLVLFDTLYHLTQEVKAGRSFCATGSHLARHPEEYCHHYSALPKPTNRQTLTDPFLLS